LLARLLTHYLRWFHRRTAATLVPSVSQRLDLERRGFERLALMARGVDPSLFNPARRSQALRESWGLGADDIAGHDVFNADGVGGAASTNDFQNIALGEHANELAVEHDDQCADAQAVHVADSLQNGDLGMDGVHLPFLHKQEIGNTRHGLIRFCPAAAGL
jgi:hypothetical protein